MPNCELKVFIRLIDNDGLAIHATEITDEKLKNPKATYFL